MNPSVRFSSFFFTTIPPPPRSTLFPYTTLFRSYIEPNTFHSAGPELKDSVIMRLSQNLLIQRSEEHTSELQSRLHLVCRLLLEKKKIHISKRRPSNIHTMSCFLINGHRRRVALR